MKSRLQSCNSSVELLQMHGCLSILLPWFLRTRAPSWNYHAVIQVAGYLFCM